MNKAILLVAFITFAPFWVSAQIEDRANLPDSEVEVIKDYRARITEARIIPIEPTLPPLDTSTQLSYNYVVKPQTVEIVYDAPQLKPVAMKKPNPPRNYPLQIKAGYGTQKSPFGRIHYHWSDNDEWDVHAYGLYQASDNTANQEHQKYRDIDAEINLRRVLYSGAAIHAAVNTSQDRYNFYGFNNGEFNFPEDEVRRTLNSVGARLGVDNAFRTVLNVDYSLHGEIRRTVDQDSLAETYVRAQGGIHKWFNDKHRVGIDIAVDNSGPDQEGLEGTASAIAQPQFSTQLNKLKIKGGLSTLYNGDSWTLRPMVEAKYNISGSQLLLFGGFNSTVTNQHLFRVSSINPFINPERAQLVASSSDDLTLGAEGTVKQINYHLRGGYSWLRDELLFVNNENDGRLFDLLQDNGKKISFLAQVDRTLYKTVRLATSVEYNKYSMENEAEAWHLPALRWALTPSIGLFKNQLKVELRSEFLAGIKAKDQDSIDATTLPALIDVSLGADYFVTENIGAYIHLNNIANQDRARWNNYPQLGFNAHAGVLVKF